MMRSAWAMLCLVALCGCVTTTTGTRGPAPEHVQLQAQLDLARGYLEQRSWRRARDPLERAIAIDPRSAEAYALMGVMYQGQQEVELAEEAYRRALRYNPRDAQALNNYGALLYANGRYEEALDPLRTLVQDSSYRERARAYENLALTEQKVGNTARARDAFQRALSFNVVLPRSSLALAEIAYQEADYRTAAQYYDMFTSRARQTPESLCLGIRLARHADDRNRLASYEIALKNLYPDSAEASRCIRED
jgi:type IV pilus assembly protein PilF